MAPPPTLLVFQAAGPAKLLIGIRHGLRWQHTGLAMEVAPLEYLLARPWHGVSLPPEVTSVPTMLSREEQQLLYVLARDRVSDDGAIVDAGCFLGGSTAALLAGLRDRSGGSSGPAVASFDRFRVEEYTIPRFFRDDPSVRAGDSFRPRFDRNVAGFGVPHRVCEGNVMDFSWTREPIDILFIDLDKSWKLNDALLREWFPFLVPGRSVVVQQDYGWGGMPWIPITMELLVDSVRLIDGMKAGSHVFYVERELPADVIRNGVSGISYQEKLALLDSAIGRLDGWVRGMTELSRAQLIAERDADAALADISDVRDRYDDEYVLLCLEYVRDTIRYGGDAAAATHGQRTASVDRRARGNRLNA